MNGPGTPGTGAAMAGAHGIGAHGVDGKMTLLMRRRMC